MVTSSASITTRDTEPGEALDPVLILRPLRDDGGRVSDAIIEFANAPWRSAFGSADRDPSGLRLLEAFPAFADRIAYLGRAIGTGESFRLLDTMPGDPSRRFVTQMTPHGASVIVVSHEVTREHALEEALASSAEGLRTFFDAVDDMVVVSALDGRIAYEPVSVIVRPRLRRQPGARREGSGR